MSNYKFKDLYVTLKPKTLGECENGGVTAVVGPPKTPPACSVWLTTGCSGDCNGFFTFTTFLPIGVPPEQFGGGLGYGAVQPFAFLKDQLKVALAAEEAREKACEESQKPQTVSEVDDLEEKLKGALQELSLRKTQLQQKK